jgi:hypothetical protein
MLPNPPVVPSCSPHLRGPSGVEFWFYTPPVTPPRGHSYNSPGIESAPGCGPGRASAAPAGPPERAAAVFAPPPPRPRLAAAPGLLEQHTVRDATRINSCRSDQVLHQAFRRATEGLLDHRLACSQSLLTHANYCIAFLEVLLGGAEHRCFKVRAALHRKR